MKKVFINVKKTIESVFADIKEKTQHEVYSFKSFCLNKNGSHANFLCMNLKKLANRL